MNHLNLWYLLAPGMLAALGVLAIAWKVWRKVSGLIDELIGKPAQFGRQATPGLIERLDTQDAAQGLFQKQTEDTLAEQGELLRSMHHELHPNGGSSMRDSVDRTELMSRETKTALADHVAQANQQMREGGERERRIWDALDNRKALDNLTEALPIVARSTPHEEDQP